MQKIVLASTSPRRKQILTDMGISFDVVSPDYNEQLPSDVFSYERIENIAENKAVSISKKNDGHKIVIGADTVVVFNNKILGKPKGFEEAFSMLSMLNGNEHIVVTSVCIINNENGKKLVNSETSKVRFHSLSKMEIEKYIVNYKPYDKAGSYGIQELPEGFIDSIEGDYNNIVGLPNKLVAKMLEEITG